MFTKISVLVPTRLRLDRLKTMIDSFERTNDGQAELIFRVDEDDLETIDFLSNYRTIVGPQYHGYRSMPLFYNEMLLATNGDILMLGNDDMVFKTSNWPSIILQTANQYPDGFFDIGVSTFNETHYPFGIVSKRIVDYLGFLWDPRLFWGDIFLRDVMNWFGRCMLVPAVQIDHEWAGHPYDVLHIDSGYWSHTHPQAVAEAVEKLKILYDPRVRTYA